jgi:limonene-1,2-epoxide hydrolase
VSADCNGALVRGFLAAWERRDTAHIMSCWADDGVYHAVPALEPIVGRAAFRQFVTSFEQVPGGRLEIHHQVASDTVVINERTDHISFGGRPLDVPICADFEIRDGLIAAWREYFDPALFAQPTKERGD